MFFMVRRFLCTIEEFFIIYLGLFLGADKGKKEMWRTVVEKMEKKLVLWKGKLFLVGGVGWGD